ncbi:MAG: hypothetical protein JW867_02060, partial [Candidatus Omnitrophica bacterium]|nr:hypothetical protein [Candidatus Omnitrophota bacterium]
MYGSILGVANLDSKIKSYKKFISLHALLILAIVLYFHQIKYHGALGLAFNRDFYSHSRNFSFLNDFIGSIPQKGLLMTQNNLAPHLTHSHDLMLLRPDYWNYMPDVIAIDIRDGQNPNNYWPLPKDQFTALALSLKKDPNYLIDDKYSKQQLIYLKIDDPNMDGYESLAIID